MIVTVQFDHTKGKWRFTIQRISHKIPEFTSGYKYTSDIDAHSAGRNAIDFERYYRMMEAGS